MMTSTPRADGLRMPAEWAEHECTLMAWPSRASLWGVHLEAAKRDYAAMARAVAGFEPVVMVCRPGDAGDVLDHCGGTVSVTEIPIDDSWTRDSGPTFVTDGTGRRAVVQFGFNGWGGKYVPYENDARLATAFAAVLGVPVYDAPMTTEGGAFFTDGEGTLLTTVGSVLNDNRNPGFSRAHAEAVFGDYLGVDTVIWLDAFPDRDTDGHIDGIAQYVAPGVVALHVADVSEPHLHPFGQANLATLTAARDARGRALSVHAVAPSGAVVIDDDEYDIPYLNHYLPNGGVIVPVGDPRTDAVALARLAEVYPDREVVGVPGGLLSLGGGGPHCITQQVPRR